MADSKAASCFCAFSLSGADTAAAEAVEPAERAGSEVLTDLGTCGLLIRFSTGLEADVFFFSTISASRSGVMNDDMRLYQTEAPARNRAGLTRAERVAETAGGAAALAEEKSRHVIL